VTCWAKSTRGPNQAPQVQKRDQEHQGHGVGHRAERGQGQRPTAPGPSSSPTSPSRRTGAIIPSFWRRPPNWAPPTSTPNSPKANTPHHHRELEERPDRTDSRAWSLERRGRETRARSTQGRRKSFPSQDPAESLHQTSPGDGPDRALRSDQAESAAALSGGAPSPAPTDCRFSRAATDSRANIAIRSRPGSIWARPTSGVAPVAPGRLFGSGDCWPTNAAGSTYPTTQAGQLDRHHRVPAL